MNEYTRQGIAAVKSGNKAEARRLFSLAIQADPDDLQAWLWLSGAVDSDSQRINCLQNVLRIDPQNALARRGLAQLAGQVELEPEPILPPGQEPAAFIPEPPTPPTPAVASPFNAVEIEAQPQPRGYTKDETPSPAADIHFTLPPSPEMMVESPAKIERKPRKPLSKNTLRWLRLVIVLLLVGGAAAATYFYLIPSGIIPQSAIPQISLPQISLPKISIPTPEWLGPATATPTPLPTATPTLSPTITLSPTPTLTPTITLTPTKRPTRTPTSTPTYIPLGLTINNEMDQIQKQVSDLRGFKMQSQMPRWLVSQARAQELLRERFITEQTKLDLTREQRALSALGFIKPTYDLVNATLNHLVDNIGGFYLPSSKEIFILFGLRFGGVERLVYSHEFAHALVDQNYPADTLGVSPKCIYDSQQCQAITALMEGDATLVMVQWTRQYATPQDAKEIEAYRPPALALPESFPPPYIEQDVNFPYTYGYDFVKYIYDQSRWTGVNRIYKNLPLSTEQIMHPKKYVSGDEPVKIVLPRLEDTLGANWELLKEDSLGEWMTYLLMAYSADLESQIDPEIAKTAAAGWGGDRYHIYANTTNDQNALVVKWFWDTSNENKEFVEAFSSYLNARYRGNHIAHEPGTCWESNGEYSCIFTREQQTLWLLAPDPQILDQLISRYPEFE